LPHFALKVAWPSISGDLVVEPSAGVLEPDGVAGVVPTGAVFTTGAVSNFGEEEGALTTLPELEDIPVPEATGVTFLAQPQTNMVNATIVNVFFICLFLYF
jgi:hypothetical protein